ncbi:MULTISPECIES: hypothetical protein [unclassified Nostoc]|uniref:hypothetical protein n=1 Tax=unclassified Nostoc TaxID=2593658 RepID=UPI002AD1D3E3|nr:hypothetical protein [Nostoc sp. DedQUE03]MDZ7971275.1 hypothetical protein [Nostoc sp. DedQUE03]MDZ8045467.1 hypothetical protein [Nostoc sp. DedQUE02]
MVSGNNFAQEQAFEQLAYLGGWALSGFWDGAIEGKNYPNENLRYKRDFAEDGAYALGYRVGDEIRNLGLQGKGNLEELWKNRPQFEIPTIKIPKFTKPEFPDFSIPQIPEFKLPPKLREKDIPRTNPPLIPESEWRRIREWIEEGENCEILFTVFQSTYFKNGSVVGREPGVAPGLSAPDMIDGTGEQIRLADGIYFIPDVSLLSGGGINAGGKYGADTVRLRRAAFLIIPSTAKNNLSVFEAFLANGTVSNYPAYTNLRLSPFTITCEFGYCQTRPQEKPDPFPPPAPPKDCDCMGCCPDIDYRKIQKIIEEELQKLTPVASLPERYQISPEGHVPQLICLFVEKRANGTLGKDYYPITIPHPTITTAPTTAPLNGYKKGSWEGILTLKDNTKVFVNAFSAAEAEQMINQIKAKVNPKYTEESFYKIGQRKGQPLKEINVKLVRCDYYAEGTKSNKPDWIKFFK